MATEVIIGIKAVKYVSRMHFYLKPFYYRNYLRFLKIHYIYQQYIDLGVNNTFST